MTNYFVAITAYERPKRLMRLLTQLRQQRQVRTEITVVYDAPSAPASIQSAVSGKGHLITPKRHCGKENYWRLVNMLWTRAQRQRELWDYVLFIQDDISVDNPYLLEEVGEEIEVINFHVPRVASFNLYGDGPNFNSIARWTGRPVVEMENGYVLSNWVDMACAVFTGWAFDLIPALTAPDPDREGQSSGVGRQISRDLDEGRCAQVMVPEPWVEHRDGGTSKMHPNAIKPKRRHNLS